MLHKICMVLLPNASASAASRAKPSFVLRALASALEVCKMKHLGQNAKWQRVRLCIVATVLCWLDNFTEPFKNSFDGQILPYHSGVPHSTLYFRLNLFTLFTPLLLQPRRATQEHGEALTSPDLRDRLRRKLPLWPKPTRLPRIPL
jgi:hypothetical protein